MSAAYSRLILRPGEWLKDRPFVRHNLVYFIGSMTVATLNYLYYPLLGRLMSPQTFGEVQTVLPLLLQLGIVITSLSFVAISITVNTPQAAAAVLARMERLSLIAVGVIAILLTALSLELKAFFRFASPAPFVALGVLLVLAVPLTFRNSRLQGLKDFPSLSIGGTIGAVAKLIFSAILVLIGLKTLGAIVGIAIAQLLALAFAATRLRRHVSVPTQTATAAISLRPYFKFFLLVFTVSLLSAMLNTVDVLVVKHYFAAREAGLYAGISTVAQIIFFATSSIVAVLLASVRLGADQDNHLLLRRSLWLLGVVGGGMTLVFVLAPRLVVQILFGSSYLSYATVLPILALAIFILSIDNLLLVYLLALRRWSSAVLALLGVAATFLLMLAYHNTIRMVAQNILYGSIFLMATTLLYGVVRVVGATKESQNANV